MRKTLLLAAVLGCSLAAGTAFAAPLDDYSQGKAALDLGFNFSGRMDVDNDPWDSAGTKSAMYGAATVGLGNNLAAQYKYDNWQSKTVSVPNASAKLTTQSHQLNLLYQVAPGISPYIGWRMDKVGGDITVANKSFSVSDTQNIAQIGVVGQYKFADNKAKVWGDMAFGTKSRQAYELGAGYEVAKNVDLNLSWQYNKFSDGNVSGWKTGVTYRF